MSIVKQAIYPVIIILLALAIRSFLNLPVIEMNGKYLSTNEVITHSEASYLVVKEEFLLRAAEQENLIAPFTAFEKTKAGDIEVLREAFDVVARIADLVIVITVFFVLPAALRRKT